MPEAHMSEPSKTSAALILVAWLIVGIPAGWGVYNTGLNAVKLFKAAPAAAPAATPAPSAAPAPAAQK